MSVTSPEIAAPPAASHERLIGIARLVRARARLVSGLVLLAFVLNHFLTHTLLIVSVPLAEDLLGTLMGFWWSTTGTVLLAVAIAVHALNALWSIYIRRYLRLPLWELAQLTLGLSIPPLIMLHVVATKVADNYFGTASSYNSVLLAHWLGPAWLVWTQTAAVMAVWAHACIGVHFWLRTKRWYPAWRPLFGALAVLIPALSLAGYVAGGNHIAREAADPDFVAEVVKNANASPQVVTQIYGALYAGLAGYAVLLLLPFAGRSVRALLYRLRRPPRLTHANGAIMPMLPGATVLETLRANAIPHASVCGGRARCTTCRIRVSNGLAALPAAVGLEAAALARIGAPKGVRLACQVRPAADIAVTPLLSADAEAVDGLVRGGMEGSERQIAVVFVDLRGSTTLGEARLPYDVLFILNHFFGEMSKALAATGGIYSNFTGDGLMAIYGLDAAEPRTGAEQALRGVREMLMRLDQLNAQLRGDLKAPLQIGVGLHFGEAIVGALGPPGSQIVTAIGDTVNTTARLESLTKDYKCVLIVSEAAARAAGLDMEGESLHHAPVKGRTQQVAFYALNAAPQPAA